MSPVARARQRCEKREVEVSDNYQAAVVVMALLPVCLGLLCFYGAMGFGRAHRRDETTLILMLGGAALIVAGLGIWSQA